MAIIDVGPNVEEPSHDMSLETLDGLTKYGFILGRATGIKKRPIQLDPEAFRPQMVPRTAFKMTVGDGKYSDLEPPYFAISQDNWNGGRGLDEFDLDQTRFMDSYRVDTTGQGIICGPKDTQTVVSTVTSIPLPNQEQNTNNHPTTGFISIASKFVPSANLTVRSITVSIRDSLENPTGKDSTGAFVYIYSDVASKPGALLATGYARAGNLVADLLDVPIVYAMTSGTTYWIAVTCNHLDIPHSPIYVGWNDSVPSNSVALYNNNLATWVTTAGRCMYYAINIVTAERSLFFEYKKAVYRISEPDDFTTPTLWLNGYRGIAASNAAKPNQINTGLTLASNALVNKIVIITGGTGSLESTPWRVITGNETTGECYVNKPWNIMPHDNTTEFVILGCDNWSQITGAGFPTKPVVDVCVTHDFVYFTQGVGTAMVRFQAYNSAGTWTNRFAADSGQAEFMITSPSGTGTFKLYMARAVDCTVWSADPVTTWVNLTWTQENGAKACGSTDRRITGLISYGDPPIPFVLKEGSIGGISKGIYAEAPLGEMDAVRSEKNGRASTQLGAYLYFSLLNGVEQFYNNDLRDMGPNREEGMPSGRQGAIFEMLSYPGRIYMALDGGNTGYSSLMAYTNPGHHELYRGTLGARIRSVFAQVIPGDTIDRLWIGEEDNVLWIPLDPNPRKNPNYTYASGGQVESGWIYNNKQDTLKAWASIKLFTENLSANHQTVTVEYKLDTDLNWTTLGTVSSSPRQELALNKTSYRIKYRLTLNTDDVTKTPFVKAVVIEGVEIMTVKFSFSIQWQLKDEPLGKGDLDEDPTYTRAETLWNIVYGWMTSNAVLTMHHNSSLWDNRKVRIASLAPLQMGNNTSEAIETHLVSMELMDV